MVVPDGVTTIYYSLFTIHFLRSRGACEQEIRLPLCLQL